MRKSVADQTEFAITYFTTWRWFDGFRISLDALHEFLPGDPDYTDIASCGADNSLLATSLAPFKDFWWA
jgi:hypothetical protein